MKAENIIYCLFSLKPFRRNKISPEKKIKAAKLYLKGLSYKQVAEILGITQTTVWETTHYQPKLLAVKNRRTSSQLTRL